MLSTQLSKFICTWLQYLKLFGWSTNKTVWPATKICAIGQGQRNLGLYNFAISFIPVDQHSDQGPHFMHNFSITIQIFEKIYFLVIPFLAIIL